MPLQSRDASGKREGSAPVQDALPELSKDEHYRLVRIARLIKSGQLHSAEIRLNRRAKSLDLVTKHTIIPEP